MISFFSFGLLSALVTALMQQLLSDRAVVWVKLHDFQKELVPFLHIFCLSGDLHVTINNRKPDSETFYCQC